ncbi:MAG: hypothetical protein WBA88_23215 [Pseudaminobacter sp.]
MALPGRYCKSAALGHTGSSALLATAIRRGKHWRHRRRNEHDGVPRRLQDLARHFAVD